MTISSGELHLYVHIPFCVHKCAYCDFNSHVRSEPAWNDYRQSLLNELSLRAAQAPFNGRRIATIFFGGGTPSLAPPGLIGSVIEAADALLGIDDDAEITMEANPGTVEAERFAAYRQAGVNRLSIGVQSFDDTELHWLERIHDAAQARAAVTAARDAGFANLSLDLMYGLPDQSMAAWLRNLEQAIDLSPEHLSCYQLTVEAHTELANRHRRHPLALPDDELSLALLRDTRSRLAEAGYEAYEVSNFARPGRECRHNDGYWLYHDYIGIGAGAAGKWDEADGGITRYADIRSPEAYMAAVAMGKPPVNSQERLALNKAAAEAVWLGLRRRDGIEDAAFQSRFGQPVTTMFAEALSPWLASGHLVHREGRFMLSETGLGMADSIAEDVLTD